MSYRKKMPARKDKKVFSNTARRTSVYNSPKMSWRGGIRF